MSDAQGAATPQRPNAVRRFGRWQLLRLAGRSERTMAWAAAEPGSGDEWLLVLPRRAPAGAAALQRWTQAVQRGARLSHPQLAPAVEVGLHDGWPYAAYELGGQATLADRVPAKGLPGAEAAALALQAASGLAFAHEGGAAHHDLQPWLLLVDDQGRLAVAGLEVGSSADAADDLRLQRDAAARDVLALGLVLHRLLAGTPALDEPDTCRAAGRLPPLGNDIVRLPWSTAQPVPEALRAIANRATDRQERQRYRTARTLARALQGFIDVDAGGAGGVLALLADRLRTAGVLPSSPGAAAQVARLALMERERTSVLAELVLLDLALAFELLRAVNTAQFRGAQVSGNGPVLTIRRAIAMLGMDGVRRAALALRPWPGPLQPAAADALAALIGRVKRAGRVAIALRPAGYDAEVVYLLTLLQNLGRLVVQYHFGDEAAQIGRLMQPADDDAPGMTEEAAAWAVLGSDIDAIGSAVARLWGLDDAVLAMVRRLPPDATVRAGESDAELLRQTASCANETVDALQLPAPQQAAALQRVVQRHGRALGFGARELQAALQEQPPAGGVAAPSRPAAGAAAAPTAAAPSSGAAPPVGPAASAAPAASASPPRGLRSRARA